MINPEHDGTLGLVEMYIRGTILVISGSILGESVGWKVGSAIFLVVVWFVFVLHYTLGPYNIEGEIE